MRHITEEPPAKQKPLCNATVGLEDELVLAALQSDCKDCRAIRTIGPIGQKGCDLQPVVNYTPEPMQGVESLEDIVKRRDG